MTASIRHLLNVNPSGLIELKPAMTIPEYRDNNGFNLKNVWTIFESKQLSGKEKFAFPGKSLENLLEVKQESDGNLLVVYIVETIEANKIRCNLILTNEAYQNILKNNTSILQVHQMYSSFFKDHVSLNLSN